MPNKTRQQINKEYYMKIRDNYITCECGTRIYKYAHKQHLKTNRHKRLLNLPQN